ncbi:SHOCT domain-containing protein [Bacillus thuringiensis]|uniref:SHOCT domain-containing protein n=1 Tax=Bacillus thuringiensis TaxID=1428 RepID=UPI0021C14D04|nr:SHOCT domain-containing protein [Bacillus thuringiensis]
MFNKHEYNNFLKAKELIEGYMNEQEKNTFASNDHPSTTIPVNNYSVADEITKLDALKDQGILTEEEFTAKKKHLLGI